MEVTDEDGEPVDEHEVQFLPFDRDSLFEALAARAESPEPQVPEELQVASDSVQALEAAWTEAEEEWAEVREQLRALSERLEGLDPRGREYLELFDQFNDLEARERRLNRVRQEAFEAFTQLQQATQIRLDSVRAVIQSWEDLAFADYVDERESLLEALGREIISDTTNASGFLTRSLPGGTWWVHSRLRVPGGELYWNEETDVSAVDTLRLTPSNAERRLAF
ncbi:MAG: hypothetical protein R3266_13175 [Gemmatimonadota bacterium]|nr:hypothetical protein [Gemmatimonadota bacterium]